MSKFCWTCGDEKSLYAFAPDPEQYDGYAAECKRCAECRELARRMDGEAGPRAYRIEGEGRRRAPSNPAASALIRSVSTGLRRRPTSGLMAVEA